MRSCRYALALVAVAGLATAAHAAPNPEAMGTVLFAGRDGLYAVPADGSGRPVKVADLRDPSLAIESIEAHGDIAQVDVAGLAGWVQLAPGQVRRIAFTRCTGPGTLSADGTLVACPLDDRTTVVQPVMWQSREVATPSDGFIGSSALALLAHDRIEAVSLADPSRRRIVAPHRPSGAFFVDPTGQRGVGVYEDGVYVFKLDGTAARRRLGSPDLIPFGWSADGRWLLLGNGNQACVVRAAGGQYKCWDGYTGIELSPHNRHVLLFRGGALYVAPVAGVEKDRPQKLLDVAAPIAAWVQ